MNNIINIKLLHYNSQDKTFTVKNSVLMQLGIGPINSSLVVYNTKTNNKVTFVCNKDGDFTKNEFGTITHWLYLPNRKKNPEAANVSLLVEIDSHQ